METENNLPALNEIVLFQFNKKDKWRIYRFMKKNDLHISLITNDLFILGIYIPPKKLINSNVFLDQDEIKKYVNFEADLSKYQVYHYTSVYDKKHTLDRQKPKY